VGNLSFMKFFRRINALFPQYGDNNQVFIYPTDVQLDCSKRMSQFTLKFTLKCSYMFRFCNHHQGANVRALLKL